MEREQPLAVVMNMFYTGLGIARSLGERGIPVLGLTAKRSAYGNVTRFAEVRFAPDSRDEPEQLLSWLLDLGKHLSHRAVIFPTRDHDLVFLDRFRAELDELFSIAVPRSEVLPRCLNKSETHKWAVRAGVATPPCWTVEKLGDLNHVMSEVSYPCVLKPLSAHHWREHNNWNLVGARKAVIVGSPEELRAEYRAISRADCRILVQELIPGGDDGLHIVACYIDRAGRYAAGFHARKLLQVPEGLGTGCVVETVADPGLRERTERLLRTMGFTGIAEVEYKWDAVRKDYFLIEVNARPWDQHRLGSAAGVDLIYLSYCDHAGIPAQTVPAAPQTGVKWLAEDAFIMEAVRLVWNGRLTKLLSMLRLVRGKRVYGIWSVNDPSPFFRYVCASLLPGLAQTAWRALMRLIRGRGKEQGVAYENRLEKGR